MEEQDLSSWLKPRQTSHQLNRKLKLACAIHLFSSKKKEKKDKIKKRKENSSLTNDNDTTSGGWNLSKSSTKGGRIKNYRIEQERIKKTLSFKNNIIYENTNDQLSLFDTPQDNDEEKKDLVKKEESDSEDSSNIDENNNSQIPLLNTDGYGFDTLSDFFSIDEELNFESLRNQRTKQISLVKSLIELQADPHHADNYTGWTAAHWAAASRNVSVFVWLYLKYHVNLMIIDKNGKTPLDMLHIDFRKFHDLVDKSSQKHEIYICREKEQNSNADVHMKSKIVKNLEEEDIVSVTATQYHHLVLTKSGKVYTWGIGDIVPLGYQCSRQSVPRQILGKDSSSLQIVSAATSLSHTALVNKFGQLYTFGSGEGGQLGLPNISMSQINKSQNTNSSQIYPKLVFGIMKQIFSVSVCVSTQHTVVLSDRGHVYTFGRGDLGQLGYGILQDFQSVPRIVSSLVATFMTSISCIDSGTVCVSDSMDVFWWGWKCPQPSKVKFSWGYPSVHAPAPGCEFKIISTVCLKSGILILASSSSNGNEIYSLLPRPNNQAKKITLFDTSDTVEITTNASNVFAVTSQGIVYTWSLSSFEDKGSFNNVPVRRIFSGWLRPVSLSCGTTTEITYKVTSPTLPIVQVTIDPSTFSFDMEKIWNTLISSKNSTQNSDVKISLSSGNYFCHSYIISRSSLFNKILSSLRKDTLKVIQNPPESTNNEAFRIFLQFLYTSRISTTDLESNKNCLTKIAITYGATEILHLIGIEHKPHLKETISPLSSSLSPLVKNALSPFDQDLFKFYPNPDICIEITDDRGVAHTVHTYATILAARCPYFEAMLSVSHGFTTQSSYTWREHNQKTIPMDQISSLESALGILTYLYSDELPSSHLESPSALVDLFVLADVLLLPRLLKLCAKRLIEYHLNMSTVAQLLELASLYRYKPLREACTRYLVLNFERCLFDSSISNVLLPEFNNDALTNEPSMDLNSNYYNLLVSIDEQVGSILNQIKRPFISEATESYITEYVSQISTNASSLTSNSSPPKHSDSQKAETKAKLETASLNNSPVDKKDDKCMQVKNENKDKNISTPKLTPLQQKELKLKKIQEKQTKKKEQEEEISKSIPAKFSWINAESPPQESVSFSDILKEEQLSASQKRQKATNPWKLIPSIEDDESTKIIGPINTSIQKPRTSPSTSPVEKKSISPPKQSQVGSKANPWANNSPIFQEIKRDADKEDDTKSLRQIQQEQSVTYSSPLSSSKKKKGKEWTKHSEVGRDNLLVNIMSEQYVEKIVNN